jgi:hypothetical protein
LFQYKKPYALSLFDKNSFFWANNERLALFKKNLNRQLFNLSRHFITPKSVESDEVLSF